MKKLISIRNPKSPIAENYRGIRTNIEFANIDGEIKVINITSSRQNEGKSTVMANLAVTFASLEKKVLILDGDLRNPTVHRVFNKSNINGVTSILRGSKNFLECVQKTEVENLYILSAGELPANPSETLASKKMKDFIEVLKSEYDYIFIDSPPIGIVSDAGVTSRLVDGTIFVVASGETDIEVAISAKEKLEALNANILGVVLNKFDVSQGGYEYYNYYYQQDDRAKKKKNKRNRKKAMA